MVGPEMFYSPLLVYARSIEANGPNVETVQPESQATPFGEDFLKILRGELSTAFGTGVGPNQREAGTALRQFIQSLQGSGGGSEGLNQLISGIETSGAARIERGAADLREQGGILGQRFGSSLAQGEGLFRAEAGAKLDQTIGGLREQGRQFDQTALFEAIQGLFGQGQASLDFLGQFAKLGILPEEIIVSPSTTTQVVTGVTGAVDTVSGFFGS